WRDLRMKLLNPRRRYIRLSEIHLRGCLPPCYTCFAAGYGGYPSRQALTQGET
ncbi:hypothetical protein NL676_034578, partial [Syzygium grande]